MALEVTDATFQEMVANSDKPVMVDFWAQWCGPCLAMNPVIQDLSKEYDGKAVIAKVDVDSNPEISSMFGIRNIPTLLFFKNGEVVDKQVGAAPKAVLARKIDSMLG